MRDSVTFIHAADLHLGAPFQGLATDNEAVGRELAEATYSAWRRVVDEAIAREVDFVLVAGDLYDAADSSLTSQFSLREQATRLDAKGIPLLIVRGNHDPLSGWSANLPMPENVHEFAGGAVERFEVVAEDDFVCAVYGRSFQRQAETADFTPGYERDARDTVAIGLLHTNVGNNSDYESYAPSTLGGLCACRMDYWALGHIHKHDVLGTDPHVVYAGSPQGLNPKETGRHGCCLVTITRGAVSGFEHIDTAPVLWAIVDVDISGLESIEQVESRLNAEIDAMRVEAGRPVAARVKLVGRAVVHSDVARPGVLQALANSIRVEQSLLTPWVWLDRLTDASSMMLDIEALAQQPDFAGELVRVAGEIVADAAELEQVMAELRQPVLEKLSDHVPTMSPQELLEAARDRALDLLLAEDGEAR